MSTKTRDYQKKLDGTKNTGYNEVVVERAHARPRFATSGTKVERKKPMPIRVVVADSQPVVRAGLFSFFAEGDVQIVDEAQTAEQTVAKTIAAWPDALLLDVRFPDHSGFDVVAKLRAERFDKRVVFFTSEERLPFLARAVVSGADSYLLKSTSREELTRVAREIATCAFQPTYVEYESLVDAPKRVETFGINAGELRRVASLMQRRVVDPLDLMTERESQVLRHIAMGLSNKEIASSLQLSLDTIKEHVQNILRKLDVDNRAQAAVWAVRNKLVP